MINALLASKLIMSTLTWTIRDAELTLGPQRVWGRRNEKSKTGDFYFENCELTLVTEV